MDEEHERRRPLLAAAEPSAGWQTAPPQPDLEQIYREHHGLVFRAAYRVTGNAGDAEDVMQNVFLRLLRRDPESGAMENVESYLYRAAVNTALDLMRSRQKGVAVPLEDLAPVLVENPARGPDRAYTAGEIRAWLRETVSRFSPRAAEIFALKFYEGKGNQEIAEIVGSTPGSVAGTLHRVRQRLEQEFRFPMGEKS